MFESLEMLTDLRVEIPKQTGFMHRMLISDPLGKDSVFLSQPFLKTHKPNLPRKVSSLTVFVVKSFGEDKTLLAELKGIFFFEVLQLPNSLPS